LFGQPGFTYNTGMKNARFEMKVPEDLLGRVDQWRGQQSDVPNRSEAIRRLIEAGLKAGTIPNRGTKPEPSSGTGDDRGGNSQSGHTAGR